MKVALLVLVLPWLGGERLPSQNRYEYRRGCSTGGIHCKSCRPTPWGTCHEYRRYFDYPWHSPRPYFVPPCYDTSTLPDIIHITPPPFVDETSPSDRKF